MRKGDGEERVTSCIEECPLSTCKVLVHNACITLLAGSIHSLHVRMIILGSDAVCVTFFFLSVCIFHVMTLCLIFV